MVICQYVDKDRQWTYKFNIEARSGNHYCRGKAISITYSKCVFEAFVTQDAMRMRRIILSFVACLVSLYFPTLFHKRHDFRKKSSLTWNVSFDFSLQYLSEIFPTLRRNGRDIILNVHRSSRKAPVRVVRFKARIFSTDFRKILKYQII